MTQAKNNIIERHYDYMMIAMVPLLICACFVYGRRVVLISAVAMLVARASDVFVAGLRKQEIDMADKSSTVAALTFAMMLPVSIPLYIVVMSVAAALFLGKHAFGGRNAYPFNLAALAMCIAAVNWPGEVFKAVKPFTVVNFWTGAGRVTSTGASQIKSGGIPYISLLDLLLGNHAAAMGTSFIILIVALGLFLIISKRITWHVPVAFLLTCAVWALAFPRIYGVSRLYSLKFELLSSGIIYYSIFMLNEPATTPKNANAKLIFGLLCGVATMFFRYYGSYEIGGCFAILIVNATQGFWDRLFEGDTHLRYLLPRGLRKRLAVVKHNRVPMDKPVKDDVAEEQAVIEPAKPRETVEKQPRTRAEKPKSKTERIKIVAEKAEEPKAETKKKVTYKAEPKAEKEVKAPPKFLKRNEKTKKADEAKSLTAAEAFDMIARAEDDIDRVEFSTRTIDVAEALRAFEERQRKEGK